MEALVEPILPPPHVFVIGSNHDATPVVEAARALGWRTTVADAHARFTRRFVGADRVLVATPSELAAALAEPYRAYAVLMTHDYERDRAFLAAALASPARYVGVLGPERRTSRMLAEIARKHSLSDESLARVHAPIGLDVGAETPAEIALAIVSEIQATITASAAGHLRARSGAIHIAVPVNSLPNTLVAEPNSLPNTSVAESNRLANTSVGEANSLANTLAAEPNSLANTLPAEANTLPRCLPCTRVR
ncbi:MAG TPA: XdhC family protein [Labilithrix sp.]